MSRSTVDELRAIRARLEDPARWTQGCLARAGDAIVGIPVRALDPLATCWCLGGAVCAALGCEDEMPTAAWGALRHALGRVLGRSAHVDFLGLYQFNDRATHAEVLALIDDAIAHESAAAWRCPECGSACAVPGEVRVCARGHYEMGIKEPAGAA